MKNKQFKPLYEAPSMEVQHIEAEAILCLSNTSGQNEGFEDYGTDYTFTFTM